MGIDIIPILFEIVQMDSIINAHCLLANFAPE